jgi:hypothetical protein
MTKRAAAAFAVACVLFGLSTAIASAAANAQRVAQIVRTGFQAQLNKEAKQDQSSYPGLRFTVTALTCVEVKTSQNYKCVGDYSLSYKTSVIKYTDAISAQVKGTAVAWHAHGGVPVG